MDFTARRSAQIVIIALFAVVVTQILYISVSRGGGEVNSMLLWTVEAVAFLALSLFALIALVRGTAHGAAWAALALGGVFNVIQVGMGLAMFGPLKDAGDALAPAFQSVVAGAFFAYFTGKFLFGFAAIVVGAGLLKSASAAAKGVGGLAIVGGLAAMGTNLYAMATGMGVVELAGRTGTAATLALALALIMVVRADAD